METHTKFKTWQAAMKQMKLQYIEKTAPGFFQASGGYDMNTKPYTEKSDAKLASAISDCLRFSGCQVEIIYNFNLSKGRTGYTPVYGETWKPVRVTGILEGKALIIDVNLKSKSETKSGADELFLRTNSFEYFSKWFCPYFPKSVWALMVNSGSEGHMKNTSPAG